MSSGLLGWRTRLVHGRTPTAYPRQTAAGTAAQVHLRWLLPRAPPFMPASHLGHDEGQPVGLVARVVQHVVHADGLAQLQGQQREQ